MVVFGGLGSGGGDWQRGQWLVGMGWLVVVVYISRSRWWWVVTVKVGGWLVVGDVCNCPGYCQVKFTS